MKTFRVYVDTSVIGGCQDDEFAEDSLRLFEAARYGRLVLLISAVVTRELASAPPSVLSVLVDLPKGAVEDVALTREVIELRDAYVAEKILSPRYRDDATHVAAATVARADAMASWNFNHIVRLDKMKSYNRVNLMHGYGVLTILSPKEVMTDEADNH